MEAIVFVDPLEVDTIGAWETNSCTAEAATDIVRQGDACLKLTDEGSNAQAFIRLATTPGLRYRVEVAAYRHSTNSGEWLGCVAVSFAGGRGSSPTYAARSEFIPEADRWSELSLEFEAAARHTYLILVGQNATGDVTRFDHVRVTCVGVPAVAATPDAERQTPTAVNGVELIGSPAQIGERWGTVNAQAIRADMAEYYLSPAEKARITTEELLRRSETATELARRFAPHWIEESEAVAAAAGVDPDLYLAFVGSVYRGLWRGDDCTSYAVSPEFTEDDRIFFHKNRDNAPKAQCAFIIDTQVPGVNKFISVSDASVISCMMMVNDRGLAGSADVGGLPIETPRFRGWMNTSLLRYIAERASDCEEALAIIERFVAEGHYAGGGSHGTHWLFVDRHGSILEISTNNTRVEHTWHTEKAYMSASRGAATARLHGLPEPIDFAAFHNVSRDPATCFPSSISGMSVEISRDHPEMLTAAWIAMPARSLAFPLFMGGTQTPRALLSGQVDMAGRQFTGDFQLWEPIEQFAFGAGRLLEAEVGRLLADGRPDEAREALDRWVADCTAAHLGALRAEQ
ncbi:MAG: hypothetical protein ACOX9R_10130 [Armatimonadota bacterium]